MPSRAKATWVASNPPTQIDSRRSPASSVSRMAVFSGRSASPGCRRTSVTRMVTGPVVVAAMSSSFHQAASSSRRAALPLCSRVLTAPTPIPSAAATSRWAIPTR